jgi:hypothetical protein
MTCPRCQATFEGGVCTACGFEATKAAAPKVAPAPLEKTVAEALARREGKPDTAAKAAPRPGGKPAPTASPEEREAKRQARIPLKPAGAAKAPAPPLVAGMALLFPGLGHFLCGRPGRGAAVLAAVLAGTFFATFGTVIALGFMGMDPAPGYVVGPITGMLIHVAGVVDAYLCACDMQGKKDPRI